MLEVEQVVLEPLMQLLQLWVVLVVVVQVLILVMLALEQALLLGVGHWLKAVVLLVQVVQAAQAVAEVFHHQFQNPAAAAAPEVIVMLLIFQ